MHSKQKGFTLIELMVVIAVTVIMASIAYPTMSNWLAARRVAGKAEQLANTLRLARSEAIRLNTPVYVCPVDISATGSPNNYCNSADPEGYASFADIDKNLRFNNGDLPLRTTVLNTSTQRNIAFTLGNFGQDGSANSNAATAFGFMPDGSFYRATANSGTINRVRADGVIKITLTDGRNDVSTDQKINRSVVFLLDGSGRLKSCTPKEMKSTAAADKICTPSF